jgi:hypothetical protein
MTVSPSIPPAPSPAPDTQKTAVGLLVAEAMSKSNESNQKQLQSQKALDQQMMEQNISTTIQQIMNDAPDQQTALAEVKSFLTNLNADDASWGSDIQSWLADELNTANSYKPPQDIIDAINGDIKVVNEVTAGIAKNQAAVDADNAAAASCQGQIDADEDKIRDYEKAMGNASFWDKIKYGLDIAGLGIEIGALGIAIGADKTAAWFAQTQVDNGKDALKDDKKRLAQDEQRLKNDPGIRTHLSLIASNGHLIGEEASENINDYKAAQNFIKGFDQSMFGLIEEFTHSSGVAPAGK